MTTQKQASYHSYLLRLWCEESGTQPQWRASLESAQTGDKYRFASVEALLAFLRRQAISVGSLYEEPPLPGSKE